MDWEVQDFRKKPPPPKWSEWSPLLPVRYIVGMIFYLFVLPFLFGFNFTPMGLLFNCILIDYIFYRQDLRRYE
ncbi:MAG: hypothetical protein CBD31_01760 [Flavobacteriaceae bacterium TMED171]|nr:MAG: hypothetical protein CBD31_01760 [Flavobacteriaceae bacterium TMED171]|tara:strand:- start:522 stop:740 length:219 start_codon:yes stop_codon:yes gene_type:complete